MTHSTSQVLGVRLGATVTTAEHTIGTKVNGTDGTEWLYVQANGAITQYDAVGIDENYQAAALTSAMADDGWQVGFAQIAFADNEYGWVALRGSNISGRLAASCAADVALYTSGTAGVLDDTVTGFTKIDGVVAVTGVDTAAYAEVIATWPRSAGF